MYKKYIGKWKTTNKIFQFLKKTHMYIYDVNDSETKRRDILNHLIEMYGYNKCIANFKKYQKEQVKKQNHKGARVLQSDLVYLVSQYITVLKQELHVGPKHFNKGDTEKKWRARRQKEITKWEKWLCHI